MTRPSWNRILRTHALEEYRDRAADVDYPQDRPEATVTDPKLMAAQIRAWANVVDRLKRELDSLPSCAYAGTVARDLAYQMRDVAQREDESK